MRANLLPWAKLGLLVLLTCLVQQFINQFVETPTLDERMIAAASMGRDDLLESALRDGASPASQGMSGSTPLIYATQGGFLSTISRLLAHGADINAADNSGCTPLIWAVYSDRLKTVQLLIDRGADLRARDYTGQTARQRALEWNHPEIAELLRQAEQKQSATN